MGSTGSKFILVQLYHEAASKTIECITQRVSWNINYGTWVIIMSQSKFNQFITVVQGTYNRGNGRGGSRWEFSLITLKA